MAYPSSVDTFNVIGTTNYMDEAGYVLHQVLNQLGSATNLIETTLGTNSGTSVLKNCTAGNMVMRMNTGGTMQDTVTKGTAGAMVLGTPTITGGTHSAAMIGTCNVTGGTVAAAIVGTSTVQGGTANSLTLKDTRHTRFNWTDAATVTVSWALGDWGYGTLGGNRTFSFTNGQAGGYYILQCIQDATGTRTATFGTNVLWPSKGTTVLSTGTTDIDFIGFLCDGTYYHAVGDALDLS